MDGPIDFYDSYDELGCSRSVADVLDVWVKPVDDGNHLGRLEDGAITLRGPTKSFTDIPLRQLRSDTIDRQFEWVLSIQWDEPDLREHHKLVLALYVSIWKLSSGDECVFAILVTPVEDQAKWVRVGVLKLMFWGKKVGATEFLATLEQRTVTII